MKLQEQILFREKFQLENDFELIYTIPRQRLFGFMHLLSTCASVGMCVFVILHFHRDMIDLGPLWSHANEEIPVWMLYTVATLVSSMFVGGEQIAQGENTVHFLLFSIGSHVAHTRATVLCAHSSLLRPILPSRYWCISSEENLVSK